MSTPGKRILFIILLAAAAWLLWPKKMAENVGNTALTNASSPRTASGNPGVRSLKQRLSREEAVARGVPYGSFERLFDKASNANRFLFAKGRDDKFRPDSDAPSGMDLWLQDESGNNRLVHPSITRAKFSPDGDKIAFTSSDGTLHVEDLSGNRIGEVAGVYGPSWSPDGTSVIFSKVGEGQDPLRPGTRQLSTLDVATGRIQSLTDGRFDDGRPEFNPTSDWVLFVSGARSGIASFWKVSAEGGIPEQVTNVGLQQVTKNFVPTPYDKTMWSPDKQWFVYDFKAGEQQETWGLQFDSKGKLKRAAKLADGINPRLQEDGRTLVCEKTTDTGTERIVATLP